MQHELKIWPIYFDRVEEGIKSFEVWKNDRDFQAGDELFLREWCPIIQQYTGRQTLKIVQYVLHGGQFGIHPDYVVMALK